MEDSNRREAVYEAVETRYMGLVGEPGLEPGRLAAHDPKSCSSTSSDTPPRSRRTRPLMRREPTAEPLNYTVRGLGPVTRTACRAC